MALHLWALNAPEVATEKESPTTPTPGRTVCDSLSIKLNNIYIYTCIDYRFNSSASGCALCLFRLQNVFCLHLQQSHDNCCLSRLGLGIGVEIFRDSDQQFLLSRESEKTAAAAAAV